MKYYNFQIPTPCLFFCLILLSLLAGGCTSIGTVTNLQVQHLPEHQERYSFKSHVERNGVGDVFFLLAFSGGGTRAAALSYGVLEELSNTFYEKDVDGSKVRLLDEIDRINGVSGGSFTAAYYGLFGDKIFDTFKSDFLYKDIEGELTSSIFNVFRLFGRLFSGTSRTEDAIRVYDEQIFKGKTFADLNSSKHPFILINATDLNSRDQFFFTQDYFDLLCSDLSTFKVARAAAASSAVPIIFDPVLVKRHQSCNFQEPEWLIRARNIADKEKNQRLDEVVAAMDHYLLPENPPYATLVDGGVTDNLGIRPVLNNMMLFSGTEMLSNLLNETAGFKHVVVLVVNASTTAETDIGKSDRIPSIPDILTAVTDIQLHKYNLESSSLLSHEMKNWVTTLKLPGRDLTPYYIELSIEDANKNDTLDFFNTIPTSFSLEKEQVDRVITTAKILLRKDPEYQKLLHNLGVKTKQ